MQDARLERLGAFALLCGLFVANLSMAQAIAASGTCRGTGVVWDVNLTRYTVNCTGSCDPQTIDCEECDIGSVNEVWVCACDGEVVDQEEASCRPVAYQDFGGGGDGFLCHPVNCPGECKPGTPDEFGEIPCNCN